MTYYELGSLREGERVIVTDVNNYLLGPQFEIFEEWIFLARSTTIETFYFQRESKIIYFSRIISEFIETKKKLRDDKLSSLGI